MRRRDDAEPTGPCEGSELADHPQHGSTAVIGRGVFAQRGGTVSRERSPKKARRLVRQPGGFERVGQGAARSEVVDQAIANMQPVVELKLHFNTTPCALPPKQNCDSQARSLLGDRLRFDTEVLPSLIYLVIEPSGSLVASVHRIEVRPDAAPPFRVAPTRQVPQNSISPPTVIVRSRGSRK